MIVGRLGRLIDCKARVGRQHRTDVGERGHAPRVTQCGGPAEDSVSDLKVYLDISYLALL